MLAVLSPAKTLDFDRPASLQAHTQPQFVPQAEKLMARLRQLSPDDLAALMSISPALAELNHQRNEAWRPEFVPGPAKQALLAFQGDVYQGLDAATLSEADLAYAQQSLRILSGLYGLLRPLDLMRPYRLEMGTSLDLPPHRNLYQFWGGALTDALNAELARQSSPVLVNLASQEYFKAVQPARLKARLITPIFKERKGDKLQLVSFFAKKARGLMARYLVQHRLSDPEALKAFSEGGYAFQPALSTDSEWVFVR